MYSISIFCYYYAAFNAPCVGHKDDELQARLHFTYLGGGHPTHPPLPTGLDTLGVCGCVGAGDDGAGAAARATRRVGGSDQ